MHSQIDQCEFLEEVCGRQVECSAQGTLVGVNGALILSLSEDRLVLLLDTGSSAFVRNTAADQLADVQKSHPEELFNLLGRVFPFLKSKKWDTRIAAARAIGGIVANCPQWDPNAEEASDAALADNLAVKSEVKTEDGAESASANLDISLLSDGMLNFETFDLEKVIQFGGKLLGSGGKEYEDMYANLDPIERLQKQKKTLNSRLGLAGQYMEVGLLDESDVKVEANVVEKVKVETPEIKTEVKTETTPTPPADGHSSARLRAMAKRRAKLQKGNNANKVRIVDVSGKKEDGGKTVIKDDTPGGIHTSENDGKLLVEGISPIVQLGAGKVWPFEGLCELLMVDLFDDNWETRHGAALGLREVVKVHGKGAGRVRGSSVEENDARNRQWIEDLACRLCCIFALDRFGDYVGDQVVAPVRESSGQTLGALLLHMDEKTIRPTFTVLHGLVLQKYNKPGSMTVWEARHGGMLGLRYLVSVRTDLLFKDKAYLDDLYEAVLSGLRESDDDVQAVSAATLIPVISEYITLRPDRINELMSVLWECLTDLRDDLSASIGNVMDLLGKLCAIPRVLDVLQINAEMDPSQDFRNLVPRLYPFFRHSITNVRKSVLTTMLTLLGVGKGDGKTPWVTTHLLRLVFQVLLVEQNPSVTALAHELWTALLAAAPSEELTKFPFVGYLSLLMTPIGVARHSHKMETSLFVKPSGGIYSVDKNTKRKTTTDKETDWGSQQLVVNIDNPILLGDISIVPYDVFLRIRVTSAGAFAQLLRLGDESLLQGLQPRLDKYARSKYSTQRLVAALIFDECGPSAKLFLPSVSELLVAPPPAAMYADITPFLKAVRTQALSALRVFADAGGASTAAKLPQLPILVQGEADAGPEAFSLEQAQKLIDVDVPKLRKTISTTARLSSGQLMEDSLLALSQAMEEAHEAKTQRDVSIQSTLASAVIHIGGLPPKLNGVIRALMDSIKGEEHVILQDRAAATIVHLVDLFGAAGKTGATDKIIKNLCAFLCVDTSETPEFHFNEKVESNILSLRKEEAKTDPADVIAHQREVKAARIKRGGAQTALQGMLVEFGDHVFEKCKKLESIMFDPLKVELNSDSVYAPEDTSGQSVVDSLSIIRALVPCLSTNLHSKIMEILPSVFTHLGSKFAVVRYAAAKCFATICATLPLQAIPELVRIVLPMLNDPLSLHRRQGAVECIYHLAAIMGNDVLPYVVFLIVPILGRMSDADQDVRLIATTTFAQIVKLVPLESGIPDPEGMSKELLEGRDKEREFLQQMLDVSKIKPFPLPVSIKATLRKYQQDGVNWLAFLNKYQLHGILCDDMGLGKTLQTICIVSSDHYLRAEKYKELEGKYKELESAGNTDAASLDGLKSEMAQVRALPSLIVCPPTLIGHWKHELNTYAPFLSVLMYAGHPSQRYLHADSLHKYDIVVTSYDICRNDNAVFTKQQYNYCVLDEGHIIKNPQSRLTQSVKKIHANHRLILSGTPIQNNVLELWSLFDFLMPGFLGTEKVFNERFAKPIASSRNSKSSSKEQEAGALALEALHKQVLPFLLRRLKEDVLSDLPPKIIQDYYCELSELQRELYGDFAKKQKSVVENEITTETVESKQHVFQALQYMRKLCNHPALVLNERHPKFSKIMKQFGGATGVKSINNAPKLQALQRLLLDCGIGETKGAEAKNGTSKKQHSEGDVPVISQHRALIFCQLKDMLDIVENELFKKYMPTVTFMRLDGSTEARHRHDIVQKFNADPSIDVLLLTTHVGGLGLNLTGADTVIFVEHDWNPMNDLQAMDRAHRIGQKKVVNVYRLITRNTLEEKIMGLQKFKLNIASTVINQQNSGLSSMDTDQLLDLFNVDDVAAAGNGTAAADANAEDAGLDATGSLGKKNPALADLGELWDEGEYTEEYNLDNFIQSLK
ncbi:hypothetical protein B0I72DRAFT_127595 [Yarrowia lipolytica]|nr:hypothetical protein B0I72DRAFT_127595 [Yarrowia lipolytica]RDW42932.1 hypothetical protein B0I74DRAFT_131573 [Yarrowia lipolytica]RDW49664.1 hypothetical protein B0I75DRAFT_131437 [Yarrowia lipolytica]